MSEGKAKKKVEEEVEEEEEEEEEEKERSILMSSCLKHFGYALPHGSLQFLLAAPIALIPALRDDKRLGISGAGIDLALGLGTAANALGKVCNGPTVDAVGAMRFAFFALIGAVLMVTAFSLASSKLVLLGTFIFLQFAASGGWLIGCKVIHDTFCKTTWARNFAALSIASRTASMSSKLLLGAMLGTLSWQKIGLIAALIGILLTLIDLHLLGEISNMQRHHNINDPYQDAEIFHQDKQISNQRKGIALLLRDRGLILYSTVCAGATCVAACENLTPVLLGDLSNASQSHVTMTATAFPAGLLSAVLILPPVLNFIDTRKLTRFNYNSLRLTTEVTLLCLSALCALGLASLASHSKNIPLPLLAIFVYCLAFGAGFTFYITPNVYALEFGGANDCATASAILDTFGLTASCLWSLIAAALRRALSNKYRTWYLTMLILSVIILATAALSIIAAYNTGTISKDTITPNQSESNEALVIVRQDLTGGQEFLRSRGVGGDVDDRAGTNSFKSYFGLQQHQDDDDFITRTD
uniref:Major facilitator superfamily (MFS) profile domain-containing protein n=1 Tax=Aureoumbra lagunensis TaxID=44058 RepID=A0A7S3NLN5_9STRA